MVLATARKAYKYDAQDKVERQNEPEKSLGGDFLALMSEVLAREEENVVCCDCVTSGTHSDALGVPSLASVRFHQCLAVHNIPPLLCL